MTTTNSIGTLEVSEQGRIHVGNVYNQVLERTETPPQPTFTIPFRRDTDFVKRETILDRMRQICLEPASRVALVGLGGMGKSQLAIEHAYRIRDMFRQENKDIWTFWVHASTRARVEESYRHIADTVKIYGRNQPNADIFQLVFQWLRNERNGQWLMVLDSADFIDVFYNANEKTRPTTTFNEEKRALWTYLPQSPNGSILVTTRDKELAFRLTGGYRNIIDVGQMDRDHALELLAVKSGSEYDQDDGEKLVEALEYMPLAISQAAAYIQAKWPRTSVKKYLNRFQKSERNKLSLLNHDAGALRRDRSATNSVITTWQISFNFLRLTRPSATDLLSLMSFFDCEDILESLVRPIDQNDSSDNEEYEVSNSGFEDDIATLRNYCLITTNETGEVFEMHGLVQLSTRKWLDANGETEKFKEAFINRLYHALPTLKVNNWISHRQFFLHAEKAMYYRPINKDSLLKWAKVVCRGGWFFMLQCKDIMAETMATIARNVFETEVGTENTKTLHATELIKMIYWQQERWDEAKLLEIQLLDIRKRVLGPEHPQTLNHMDSLASIYRYQKQRKEAESLMVKVVETRKRVLGPEHSHTLLSMVDLAHIYEDQNRREEAISLIEQITLTGESLLKQEHPDMLQVIGELAYIHGHQKRWKEAELLWLQVLNTRKRVLGLEHPQTLVSMSSLAITWYNQGRNHDALELLEESYQIRTRVWGPEHPSTQNVLRALQRWKSENVEPQERMSET
ncbi:P-loop containing nucleoside triphosphate hydrolase protein [Xylaria arbuscula]|nr:P-loop containing nucleoside triphosphate hydrolase protein [Xylaria arbuscula]